MIARCAECSGQIRDCTVLDRGHYAIGWYHISDGHETCLGRTTRARPQPLVSVHCRIHPRRLALDCHGCEMSSQVMIYFHNNDRCIPVSCNWPHVHGGP